MGVVFQHATSSRAAIAEIVVLQKGVVAERGSHAALLERNGLYADMWRLQSEGDADADADGQLL